MAITTSSSINVNALEDERLVFTPRNWYSGKATRLAKREKHKSGSLFPVLRARFWVSSWDTGFRGFTFKRRERRERGGAEGRRVKRGMMLPSPSTSNLEIPCSVFDILSLRSRCPVLALGQALHIKKRPGTWPGLWCVFSFWLINQITRSRRGQTASHRWQE